MHPTAPDTAQPAVAGPRRPDTYLHNTAEALAASRRQAVIGDMIRTGNFGDVTPEALEWYVRRADRLEAFARSASGNVEEIRAQLGRALS